MRAGTALAVVAVLSGSGLALRANPPSMAPVTARHPAWRMLADVTGEVRGRLVRVDGCEGDVWVASIPGYLTAVSPADVDWGRGPAEVAYSFGGRSVSASLARTVMLTARAGEVMSGAMGLSWRLGGLDKAMAPASCQGAAEAALGT